MPNLPIVGQTSKGTVIGVSLAGAGIAGFLVYRSQKKKTAAAAAAQANTDQTATDYTGDQSGTMPADYYGSTYGDGTTNAYNPGDYYGYGTPTGGITGPLPPSLPNTTNAQWAQAAIDLLSQEGYDPQAVSAALGAYELGQPVTPQQQTIVQSAIGVEGYPPNPGANGYPPGIHVQGTPGGGSGGGQPGPPPIIPGEPPPLTHQVMIPNVVGDRAQEGLAKIRQAGFRAKTVPFMNPARTYTITGEAPAAGLERPRGSLVVLNVKPSR